MPRVNQYASTCYQNIRKNRTQFSLHNAALIFLKMYTLVLVLVILSMLVIPYPTLNPVVDTILWNRLC